GAGRGRRRNFSSHAARSIDSKSLKIMAVFQLINPSKRRLSAYRNVLTAAGKISNKRENGAVTMPTAERALSRHPGQGP
ncbi:hypothetical protein ACPPTR_18015, partial [Ralstonia pseudosolanacearum]|uniref:hypothetical protein n=1 Tax=Ralstonia pseudosolanacearum TaxID=1310165 RepID=UPI003C7E77A3